MNFSIGYAVLWIADFCLYSIADVAGFKVQDK